METRSVRVREWAALSLAAMTFFGITTDRLKEWVVASIPRLAWLVASVELPWLLLPLGAAIVAGVAYLIGRFTGSGGTLGHERQLQDEVQAKLNQLMDLAVSVTPPAPSPLENGPDEPAVARSVEPSTAKAVPQGYVPSNVETEIVKMLRWADSATGGGTIKDAVRTADKSISATEVDLALSALYDRRWITRRFVHTPHRASSYYVYKLEAPAMEFAKQKGFPHAGASI
jgi:hypothetical protein